MPAARSTGSLLGRVADRIMPVTFVPSSRRSRVAHRRSLERETMRVMDQAIADRIGDTGLANGRRARPSAAAGWQSASDLRSLRSSMTSSRSRRSASVSEREQPIIDREEIELGEFGQEPAIRSVAATDRELVEQARRAHIGGGEAMATRALDKGGGQPRFADPGRARDQQIVVIPNPAARAEAEDDLARQAARRGEIDILERGGIAQLRVPQALRRVAGARGRSIPYRPAGRSGRQNSARRADSRCVADQTPSAIAVRCNAWSFSIVGMCQHRPPRSRSRRADSRASAPDVQGPASSSGSRSCWLMRICSTVRKR